MQEHTSKNLLKNPQNTIKTQFKMPFVQPQSFHNFPDNASRECSPTGEWAPTTDYNDCMCNSTEDCQGGGRVDETGALEISIIIYLVGYVLSFLALCGALTIFLSFR